MRRAATVVLVAVVSLVLNVGAANAITFGQPDGNRHPNVGALMAEFDQPGHKDVLCSGTLIAPTVFLTAAHCTDFLASIGIGPSQVWVTFDPAFDEHSTLIPGTYHTNPLFGHDQADPHDIAVVVLSRAAAAQPASLPAAGLLDQLKAQHVLADQRFTAVGYGTVKNDKTGGSHNFFFDGVRRFVDQGFNSLTASWLRLSENPSTGSGGTCFGDSGGPHFLGDSGTVVALTVTGDSVCRATDVDYRLDTPSARDFLRQFVTLP
jgi:secreted trypsin-like serine protease